jgi:hypothetical protein
VNLRKGRRAIHAASVERSFHMEAISIAISSSVWFFSGQAQDEFRAIVHCARFDGGDLMRPLPLISNKTEMNIYLDIAFNRRPSIYRSFNNA